jgi:hypothetical protein
VVTAPDGPLPPTRDEDVTSLFNEQLGTGQRHPTLIHP